MAYKSPKCDLLYINSEGVLCASLEQLKEYVDDFDWAEELNG